MTSDDKKLVLTDNMTRVLYEVARGQERTILVAKSMGKPRQNVHRTLLSLVNKGLIHKDGQTKSHYVTSLGGKLAIKYAETLITKSSAGSTSDDKRVVKPSPKKAGNLRIEDIGLKIKILKKPKNWGYDRRRIFVEQNLSKIKSHAMTNWEQVSFMFEEILVKTSDTHLLFHLPKMHHDTVWQAELDLMRSFMEIRSRMQTKLGIELSQDAEFIGLEVADIEDLVAQELPDDGFEFYENYVVWKDPKTGKIRLKFDRSPGNWEMEYAMAEWSFDDAREILRRRADEVTNKKMPLQSDMAVLLEQTIHLQKENAEQLGVNEGHVQHFGQHMATHVAVMQKIEETLEKINKRL